MATGQSYFDYISEQLSEIEGVSWRRMMGEYILYVEGKIVGGIYDDRLLVKPTEGAIRLMPQAAREIPYPGAKQMLLVDRVEDREFLRTLLNTLSGELPKAKRK